MGCSKSFVCEAVRKITRILSQMVKNELTFARSIANRHHIISEGFENLKGFPKVDRAIDGCLVEIERLSDFEGWLEKGFTAINFQAICDHEMKFMSYSMMSGSHNDKL